jgi:hypothetical protein
LIVLLFGLQYWPAYRFGTAIVAPFGHCAVLCTDAAL